MQPKSKTALVPRQPALLSGQAQQVYNHTVDLKEDLKKVREKRMNALLKDGRYAKLKKQAQEIVKEATKIQEIFDHSNPTYKKEITELSDDVKEAQIGLSRIVIEALRKGVDLQIYHGVGRGKRKLRIDLIAHPTLF